MIKAVESGWNSLCAAFVIVLLLAAQGCKVEERDGPLVEQPPDDAAAGPRDAAPGAFRGELLDIAFEAVSAMPVDPHIKNRSRGQEAVVEACLRLDQPDRGLRYLERIDNWRRGSCYADLAFHCVKSGILRDVRQYLDRAAELAETTEDWRRSRVRVKIARVYALLGQDDRAAEFEAGAPPFERGKVAEIRAMSVDDRSFDSQFRELDALLGPGDFDVLRNVLAAYVRLYGRFCGDAFRRSILSEKIRSNWERLPVPVRLDLLTEFAEAALSCSDHETALALADEARPWFDAGVWKRLDERFPREGKLMILRHRAGDSEQARAEAESALTTYREREQEILNFERADALRPLAEVFQALGDSAKALELYRWAVERGSENPNARPRADDLAETCCSMAVNGVEPDADLWRRIREIQQGLDHPW